MPPHILEFSGLFTAAFLSATFFPFQSGLVFLALLKADHYNDWVLLAVASTDNTLGSLLNWWLGRGIAHFENRRWFPIKQSALERAERWFTRWGKWSLLLSWVPIIGDPLTMIAGLRMRFLPFVAIAAVAKTGHYLAIMLAV